MGIREEYAANIERAKAEAENAGLFHKRDLQKYIRRMERELRDYDRYQAEARTRSLGTAGVRT